VLRLVEDDTAALRVKMRIAITCPLRLDTAAVFSGTIDFAADKHESKHD
jgi:hypothetical protein